MKLESYRKKDIESVIELKKLAQHQIDKIEKCNWTDNLDDAILCTLDLCRTFSRLEDLKYAKLHESRMDFHRAKLNGLNIPVTTIKFLHKKTD